jgi:hypothetical protein
MKNLSLCLCDVRNFGRQVNRFIHQVSNPNTTEHRPPGSVFVFCNEQMHRLLLTIFILLVLNKLLHFPCYSNAGTKGKAGSRFGLGLREFQPKKKSVKSHGCHATTLPGVLQVLDQKRRAFIWSGKDKTRG